ncbi:Gfo/Idh/MocA family protein [Herbiconiux ginsengi]|uniref:Predicted dehydrogenase n=1 Tax=Herbiconiux ginsengi TaxID=381665 RepID=A0A1H3LMF0_9MICO|nr:Gfo/Idh/MocA family oxidoreductase [Herbiconiux ginsengi]SDY65134.1 Predicted dehydrogenase [Herbiconiux ginsengi]
MVLKTLPDSRGEALRVGVIGCGRISRMHVRGYLDVEDVAVVAAAEPVAEIRNDFGQEFGVDKLYDDYHQMLSSEQLDIVSICTWPPLHHEMVLAAARSGAKVIFCEKPLAIDLDEADDMLAACQDAGAILVVNHYRRFAAPYRTAGELVRAGAIGNIERIEVTSLGDLLTDGTHSIDLIRFLNDDNPVVRVFAQVDLSEVVQRYGHLTEAGSLAGIDFENGVRALMELGSATPSNAYQRIAITGSAGSIDVRGDSDLRLVVKRDGHGPQDIPAGPAESGSHAFAAEVRTALDALGGGPEHPLSGDSARANLEVLIAIYESARQHAPVVLPVSTRTFPLAEMASEREALPDIELQRRAARLGA